MTEEEYFRKTYPDYCYGNRLLSPYWDLFQDGVEFGERQSEKRIEELEKENKVLRIHQTNAVLNCLEMKILKDSHRDRANKTQEQLNKAVELLKWALHSDPEHDNLVDFDTKWKEAEQFLKEIEK